MKKKQKKLQRPAINPGGPICVNIHINITRRHLFNKRASALLPWIWPWRKSVFVLKQDRQEYNCSPVSTSTPIHYSLWGVLPHQLLFSAAYYYSIIKDNLFLFLIFDTSSPSPLLLKALDTFGNCHLVNRHPTETNLWNFRLNRSLKLQEKNEWKHTLAAQGWPFRCLKRVSG